MLHGRMLRRFAGGRRSEPLRKNQLPWGMATVLRTGEAGPLTFHNAPREFRDGRPFIEPEAADELVDSLIDEYAELLRRLAKQ